MKIIFLDIDGVLTNRNNDCFLFECNPEKYKLNLYNTKCLDFILDNVENCNIVLSTTWRNYPDNYIMINFINGDVYKSLMPDLKFKYSNYIIGSAPHKDLNNKYSDICDYLNNSESITDFVVIDDDPTQGLDGFGEQFFKTSKETGLTLEISKKIIEYFQS